MPRAIGAANFTARGNFSTIFRSLPHPLEFQVIASSLRKPAASVALTSLFLAALGAVPARAAESDATLDSAARILKRAMQDARETPLTQSKESGLIITALRSTRDKGLLPFFVRLEQSKSLDNQIYGMVAAAILTKDDKRIDLELLFKTTDTSLIGSAIASLIDAAVFSDAQLEWITAHATEEIHKAMSLGELSHRGKLKDKTLLLSLLKSKQEVVRYYCAVTVLESKDAADAPAALAALKEMSEKNDLRQAPVQAMMIVRVQKEKVAAAAPWLVQIASDEKNDEGLRYTALSALMLLKDPDGPHILAEMIQKQRDTIQQVKLGLIALEFAADIKAADLAPLLQSKSPLAKSIATLAQQSADGSTTDNTAAVVKLVKEGHPIVLDWALASCEHADADRKMAIRAAVISQSTIVDENRSRDYERAAVAAQRVLENGGPAGRKLLASLLKSDNRAVVEAVLAGIYRSAETNESELVLPAWESLSRSASEETSANYAALILAREGKMEPLAWLSGMVMGGTVQSQGFRGIAGWYYAKLLNQTDVLLKKALAE